MFPRPCRVNITPHSPTMTCRVSPLVHMPMTPRALRVLYGAVRCEQRIAHDLVAFKGVRSGPVISRRSGDRIRFPRSTCALVFIGRATVPILWPPSVFIVPGCWYVAVVVLYVCSCYFVGSFEPLKAQTYNRCPIPPMFSRPLFHNREIRHTRHR